jgi:hypothetical protein
MKAKLVPIFFNSAQDPEFLKQLNELKGLLAGEADFLDPVELGEKTPEADGVIFPQLLGEAFRRLKDFQALPQPIMVVTSEFGTVSMWDWEINSYLASKGVRVVAPNTLEKTKMICRAMALKRELKSSKILAYQDNPANGTGKQDPIFKRFYWWEPECVSSIEKQYGVKIVKKSFKKLAEDAKAISDADAQKAWDERKGKTPVGKINNRQILSAIKLYMKIKEDLDADPSIFAAGMNCLNESMYCDTTPCLAWNLLYEERRLVWGCEGDLVTMLTEVLIDRTIGVPFMMSNLYPFVMGQAALKHEHIPNFPEVAGNPADHILVAHCGYLGVLPQSFSTSWILESKVLAIVDDNSTAINARMAEGPVTLVKLKPPFDSWSIIEGDLPQYAQYSNSDCLNGAVIRVNNGLKMVDEVISHHYILTTGHNLNALDMVSKVFDLKVETI